MEATELKHSVNRPVPPSLEGRRIILASTSARRRDLLSELNVDVYAAPVKNVDETFPASMKPTEVPAFLSRKKAHPYLAELDHGEVLITADTVVICNGEVLGKPHDSKEAAHMLRMLSGHRHTVVTGVTISTDRFQQTFSEQTEVEFTELTPEEIDYYIENYKPFDKAGAYGIQEWIGYVGVKGIKGDYYNVMGLPLCALFTRLRSLPPM